MYRERGRSFSNVGRKPFLFRFRNVARNSVFTGAPSDDFDAHVVVPLMCCSFMALWFCNYTVVGCHERTPEFTDDIFTESKVRARLYLDDKFCKGCRGYRHIFCFRAAQQ